MAAPGRPLRPSTYVSFACVCRVAAAALFEVGRGVGMVCASSGVGFADVKSTPWQSRSGALDSFTLDRVASVRRGSRA